MNTVKKITEYKIEKTVTTESNDGINKTINSQKEVRNQCIEKYYDFELLNKKNTDHKFIKGLGHINIGVNNLNESIDFYKRLFNIEPLRKFEKFKNIGFAKSAGFLDNPEKVSVSIAFVRVPGADIILELMEYHEPIINLLNNNNQVNDVGGVKHIALEVTDIDDAFEFVKSIPEIKMINNSPDYRPYRIDKIKPQEFIFYDKKLEQDLIEKQNVCNIVGGIKYFYFVDPYGVQWEFEQGNI